MRYDSRHRFSKSLFLAAALHGAAAVVLAWYVPCQVLCVADSGACVVDVCNAVSELEPESSVRSLAPPSGWTPSPPEAVAAEAVVPTIRELPVPTPEHSVPQRMAAPPMPPPQPADTRPTVLAEVVDVDMRLRAASTALSERDTEHGPWNGSGPASRARSDSTATAETNTAVRVGTGAGTGDGVVAGSAVRPRYPVSARMRGEQGVVAVTVDTDDDGHAQRVTVTAPSGSPALDRAAVDAARRTRFVSAGARTPGRGRVTLSYRFSLVD